MHGMFFGSSLKSTRPNCGENIYSGKHESPNLAVLSAIQAWYKSFDPKLLYKCSNHACVEAACHRFGVRNPADQIIWKCTEELGIGTARIEDEDIFYVVARYRPAGNNIDTYFENVMPQK